MRTTIDFADDVLLVARGLACRDGINIGAVLRAAILAGAHRRHEEGDRIPRLRTGPSNPSAHVTKKLQAHPAFVGLRAWSLRPVNRQYALSGHARDLGCGEGEVIDDDCGTSGDGVERPGFDRLLAALRRGEVGLVLSLEASRLARNGRDYRAARGPQQFDTS